MYSQQTLPYRIDGVNTATFIQGPMEQQRFQSIIGFPVAMAQYQGPLQYVLRLVLQENCQRNVLRCFNYNMLSSNNFCNDEWSKLVVNAGETLEYYYSIGQVNNANIMGALQQIASDVVSISVAYSIVKFPGIMGCLQPQEVQAAQALLQKSATLDAEIMALQQRKQMGGFYQNNQIPQRPQHGYSQQLSGGMSPALSQQQSPSVNGQVTGQSSQVTYAQQARAISHLANQQQPAPTGERRSINLKNRGASKAAPVTQPLGLPGGIMEESTPSGTITNVISQIPHFPDIDGIDITSTENNMQAMDYATLEADPVQRARALAASDALANEGAIIPLYNLVKKEPVPTVDKDDSTAEESVIIDRRLEDFEIIVVDKVITSSSGGLPLTVNHEVANVIGDEKYREIPADSQIMVRAKIERMGVSRFKDVAKTSASIRDYNKFITGITGIAQLPLIVNYINTDTVDSAVCHMCYSRLKMEINGILHNSLLLPENHCIDTIPDDLVPMVNWLTNKQPDILKFLDQNIELVKQKLEFTDGVTVEEAGNNRLASLVTYEKANCLVAPLGIDDLDLLIRNTYYKGLSSNQAIQVVTTITEAPFFMNVVHKLLDVAKKQNWANTRWRIYLSGGQCIVFEKPWITEKPTKMKIWIS